MSHTLSREMQLGRQEFLRELPKAIGNLSYEVFDDRVTVRDEGRRLEITMTDEGTRDVGSLHLPMERIDFDFIGYTKEEVESFMVRFDKHTLRLGQ